MNISKTKVITINNKDINELKENKMAICLQCQ